MSDYRLKRQRSDTGENPSISAYSKEHAKYANTYPTQQTYLFLLLISTDPNVAENTKQVPYLRFLSEVCELLLMNELELAMLSIVIDNVVWKRGRSIRFHKVLIAGFFAKSEMNEDMSMFQQYLDKIQPRFSAKFIAWLEFNKSLLPVQPRELNKRYRFYHSQCDSTEERINYNFYVDELLSSLA